MSTVSDRETNDSVMSHMRSLEDKNRELRRDMDNLQLEIFKQQDLREKLAALQKSHSALSEKHQEERAANKRMIKQLQDRLDDALLAKRKSEEQLLLSGAASSESGVTKSLLDDIQAKYSEEVSHLVSESRSKDKTLQEMRGRRVALVSATLYTANFRARPKHFRSVNFPSHYRPTFINLWPPSV